MRLVPSCVALSLLISSLSFARHANTFANNKTHENWASVEDNILYRSQKLSSQQLRTRVQKHEIASILCLAECTEEEQELSRELGVKYYKQSVNIPEITLNNVHEIIDVLKKAPKPLLVHCRKGADRTGMVATLYFYEIKRESLKSSIKKGLSLRYGHLGKLWTPRIYKVLEELEKENFDTK